MKNAYFVAIIILLSSCGPAGKLKRAQRLIDEAVAKGAKVTTDTVFVTKTVTVPEVRVDTLVQWQEAIKDTLIITKDRITTKIKIMPGKPVYVETVAKPDTVIVKVPVQVFKTISAGYTKWRVTWVSAIWFVIGLAVATVYWKMFNRK